MSKTLAYRSKAAGSIAAIFWALLLALPTLAQTSEVPQVPPTIRFADMTLHLTERAQREIQADVDALYRSPKYFYMKLERVDMYLPLIEPIFAEQGIPDDFKYLVIQESALIPDAISSSNAVGFWQFKEASATEVGMRVDRQIDERMNIVSSTLGAAKYLNRSNATFDNWFYSLQSYQMGLGGASRSLDKRYYGARELKIDGDTYWYVKKFLSHLVAFRDAVGKQPRSQMLFQYKQGANKSLDDIAEEFDTPVEQLVEYNKWLKSHRIPEDREYVVVIPVQIDEAPNLLAESKSDQEKAKRERNKQKSLEDKLFGEKQKKPDVPVAERDKLVITQVNGIRAVVARQGDNSRSLAKAGGISVADFLKYNDIRPGDVLEAGQVYYFKKKKKKASVYRHVAAEGETLWQISQKYGVRLDKLQQKNRMKQREEVKPGQVVWLRYIRPANEPVAFEPVPQKSEAKAAVVKPQAQQVAATPKQPKSERVQPSMQPVSQRQPLVASTTTAVVADLQHPKPSTVQTPADTPVVKPAATTQPAAVPVTGAAAPARQTQQQPQPVKQQLKHDSLQAKPAELHLYPGDSAAQRNVSSQNEVNKTTKPLAVEQADGFGAQGPVKFIDDQGRPLQQDPAKDLPPLRTEKVQEQPKTTPAHTEKEVKPEPAMKQATAEVPVQAVAANAEHVVQAGETLYGISRKYGLTVDELRVRNNMGADAVLSIGQRLRITAAPSANTTANLQQTSFGAQPASADGAASATTQDNRHTYHTVAEGETMYRVARKYNVTIKDIMEWNKKADFSIQPGETLIVGKK